jgi:hypothetical protein
MKKIRRIAANEPQPAMGSRLTFVALALALSGCGSAQRSLVRPSTEVTSRWVGPTRVPLVLEPNERARDLAALRAVLAFWGRSPERVSGDHVHGRAPEEPLLSGDLERVARAAGLSTVAFHGTLDDVVYELTSGRPVIVGVAAAATGERPHYEVVVACDPDARRLRSLDPARGFVERTYLGFQDEWIPARQLTLVLFEPEPVAPTALLVPPPVAAEHVARR